MRYIAYHDESKEFGYWHGILLVPRDSKEMLVKLLEDARKSSDYRSELGIKKVRWNKPKIFHTAEHFLEIGIGSLIHKQNPKLNVPITIREKGKNIYKHFPEEIGGQLIKAKFICFRIKDNHDNFYSSLDWATKIETSFKIGLKGGCHFLGNENSPIDIDEIHFDNHKHYGRHINRDSILRINNNLREYFSVTDDVKIDDRSNNHKKDKSQNYDDCQLLQLTDILIGATRWAYGYFEVDKSNKEIVEAKIAFKESFSRPMRELIDKFNSGPARMANSRWGNAICFSQAWIDDDKEWQYESIPLKQHHRQRKLDL